MAIQNPSRSPVEIKSMGPAITGPVGTPLAELESHDSTLVCGYCGHEERGRGLEPNELMARHLQSHPESQ